MNANVLFLFSNLILELIKDGTEHIAKNMHNLVETIVKREEIK